MPEINDCQICGAPAPIIPGLCEGVAGYRLIRNPWSQTPDFLDGNLHYSCLKESDKNTEFFREFTRMAQAGQEEVASLDGSPPPLTRMGLGMHEIFSGTECCIYQSGVSDRWMVVKRTGPWFRLSKRELSDITRGDLPRSPDEVIPYRLPVDLGGDISKYGLRELLAALGVEDRYARINELEKVEYEFIDYYPPKRVLEYVARAPLAIPMEARAFLADYAKSYIPVSFADEEDS